MILPPMVRVQMNRCPSEQVVGWRISTTRTPVRPYARFRIVRAAEVVE